MRLISFLIAIPKLLLSLLLMSSITLGYGFLASYSLLFLNCGHSVLLHNLLTLTLLVSGLYFSIQTATTLFDKNTQPLSIRGHELYSAQRIGTLWVTGSLGWGLIITSQASIEIFSLMMISILLGYAQLQLAQFLSQGRVFHLISCPTQEHAAKNFNIGEFFENKILRYADKKYLNLQASSLILLMILPLESLSELLWQEGGLAVLNHIIGTWALCAQVIIGFGMLLPCLYYIWCCHRIFVSLRVITNWLAPSFLNIIQVAALYSLSRQLYFNESSFVALSDLQHLIFNATALLLPIVIAPFSKTLLSTESVKEQRPLAPDFDFSVPSTPFAADLKERTELLF